VTAFIEGVPDGRRFMKNAAECRAKGKSIVALKIGASALAKKAISAHTAAIAGAEAVFREALRESGVIQVGDLDEMLQTVTLLTKSQKIRSRGAMLITISGGQLGLIADVAAEAGVEFPAFAEETVEKLKPLIPPYLRIRNPLDVAGVGSDDYTKYADILRACASDPSAGIVLVSQDAPAGVGPSTVDHYGKIARATAEVFLEKTSPVAMFSNHSTPSCPEIVGDMIGLGVPYLQGTRESMLAVSHLIRHSLGVEVGVGKKPAKDAAELSFPFSWDAIESRFNELAKGKKFLGEREGKEILSMLGVPVAEQTLCEKEDDLAAVGEKIGYPVVMKIESPDIPHKTEVEGVAVDLRDERELRSAYKAMMKAVKKRMPAARLDGVTLQKMAPAGVDLIVGMHKDPQFGPVMAYGLGGVYVEVFGDSALGLVPVCREKALDMVRSSKSYALLKEVRGRAALDENLPVEAILRLSAFVERFAFRLSAVDVNPVRLGPSGVLVLDALIILAV
jgi:acyl-CoA synthetase (NDP forming)